LETAVTQISRWVAVGITIDEVLSDAAERYSATDDHRLLIKIGDVDCGGLSRMSTDVEACFRQYVANAICRQNASPNFPALEHRFNQCFANRPVLTCNDWFFRTNVF